MSIFLSDILQMRKQPHESKASVIYAIFATRRADNTGEQSSLPRTDSGIM